MDIAENEAHMAAEGMLSPPAGLAVRRVEADARGELVLSFPLERARGPNVCLTPAERGVAQDLLLGLTNQEVADRRRVSVRTVANQIGSLFRKLGVHSRLELALSGALDKLFEIEAPVRNAGHPLRATRDTRPDPRAAVG